MPWRAPWLRLPWRLVLDGVAFYILCALDGLVCISASLLVSVNKYLYRKTEKKWCFSDVVH